MFELLQHANEESYILLICHPYTHKFIFKMDPVRQYLQMYDEFGHVFSMTLFRFLLQNDKTELRVHDGIHKPGEPCRFLYRDIVKEGKYV